MLFGLIDRTTSATSLKSALDRSVERSRGIADRVSKATLQNGDGFALEAKTGNGQQNVNPVNVEDEMVALADEQLRFLATSRLLEKTYQSLRTAIKGQGV
jgi:flagellar basal body rod protein FlgB